MANMPTARSKRVCRLSKIIGSSQAVPQSVHRQDVLRLWARLGFLAEVGDVDIDRAIEALVVRSEHARNQLLP